MQQQLTARKRGQSLVEFVLLAGLIVTLVTVAKNAMVPGMVSILRRQKNQISTEAWKGGERSLESYYEKSCIATPQKRNCR